MAQHIRSAKSASDWDISEMNAYNIHPLELDARRFFEIEELPPVLIQGDFVNVEKWENMRNKTDIALGFQMSLAIAPGDAEPAVDLFAIKLLERIGYTSTFRQLRLHQDLPLGICGETKHAKTDISLVTLSCHFPEGSTILLVQEDKRMGSADPVAQLIAEAIAAAAENNRVREIKGMQTLDMQIIPAISLVGTMPTFYRVPVSESLIESIFYGRFPTERTTVFYHRPVGPSGMWLLDDRRHTLRCYKAFYKYIDAMDTALSAD